MLHKIDVLNPLTLQIYLLIGENIDLLLLLHHFQKNISFVKKYYLFYHII